ncbi:Glucose/arabinose dehydrogenase, beta-propeller fold [Flagellimonas taeanensis]|uniref:Glucose/arabinose dehydrogenase, beta-propeller fold n=2 Tax=Flagellimonas taeanensis TaxID=1005926 RepID=A0A1M6WTK1_9FLAO|nr:Glucose/arabinose dehydrogenase, beta-propeller fold [Allomuricauda taeanensis]SHK97110.1 Glucose/arabinose dehydrogenase, beta-propeller fold [Allomuricauda taeanensis]
MTAKDKGANKFLWKVCIENDGKNQLEKMKKRYQKKLLYLFGSLFIMGCKTDNKHSETVDIFHDSSGNPIEEWIALDSTIIGRSTVAENLDVPWEITWGPEDNIWFTEQGGRVSRLDPNTGQVHVLLEIQDVFRKRTTGLLGLAIHPDFKKSPYVFLNYTTKNEETITSRLMRYEYANDTLINPKTILEIPGHTAHNGTRLTISPDKKLMWATGDIGPDVDNAQNVKSLNGKILRFNLDGSIPDDNPFANSPVWSWGQRNVQGMAYGAKGLLYTSEHGDATDDEVNLMQKGRNYGWPNVSGYCNDATGNPSFCKDSAVVEPMKAWTPTIAPAGIDYYASRSIPEWNNSLLLVTLKESDFRVLGLNGTGDSIVSETILFDNVLGRIRDLCISPKGDVFISTSNQDWNPKEGFPKETDDRIIRIFRVGDTANAALLKQVSKGKESGEEVKMAGTAGKKSYNMYCAACHKTDGKGVENSFPSLIGSDIVNGPNKGLIRFTFGGAARSANGAADGYGEAMPSFAFLSDADIADILTFIKAEFAEEAEKITADEVLKVRTEYAEK